MVKILVAAFYCLFIFSCNHMKVVETEMDQIVESCSIQGDEKKYKKYGVSRKEKVLINYEMALDRSKREYLSSCWISIPKKVGTILEAGYRESNSVSMDGTLAIDSSQNLVNYYVLCLVGGFSSANVDIASSPKKIIFSLETNSCKIITNKTIPPKILPARNQQGRLAIEDRDE